MIEYVKKIFHAETSYGLFFTLLGLLFFFLILWWFVFGEGLWENFRKKTPWKENEEKWKKEEKEKLNKYRNYK